MKYFDLNTVVNSYRGFQDRMTNKSWGYLAILKGCRGVIRPSNPYEVDLDVVSNFLEGVFNLSQSKREYDNGRSLFVVFSNKWDKYFNDQGRYTPNIYDVAIWAYRRKAFSDNDTIEDIINMFSREFNIPSSVITNGFNIDSREISFSNIQYTEPELKSELRNIGVDVSRENIDAKKGSVVASPGETSRGPFIQPLYAGLDISDYVLILQSNYTSLYGNNFSIGSEKETKPIDSSTYNQYLTAIRTKPFLLLAGISGTGKSQIVKEMAFSTCPDIDDLRQSEVSPGNYCLVEVKPNWHDSSELLGYDSVIKGHYVVTKFVKFVAKAMRYPEVPFFVCLDEMNLAPVEQYFAEFLSVLESRKLVNDKIISEPLIEKECFQKDIVAYDLFNLTLPNTGDMQIKSASLSDADLNGCAEIWQKLKTEGLCIPQNLIVIGTVNMDETTHQFSRKVIDRAMTFEMNEADFNAYFVDNVTLSYVADPLSPNLFLASHVSGNKAIEKIENLDAEFKKKVATMLDALNKALNDTPFKIAYRVQNELVLYFTELLRDNPDADQEQILWTALDDIMMMKVLPRIEGDDELLGNRSDGALAKLMEFASDNNLEHSIDKIDEMLKRLERSHFTSFWP